MGNLVIWPYTIYNRRFKLRIKQKRLCMTTHNRGAYWGNEDIIWVTEGRVVSMCLRSEQCQQNPRDSGSFIRRTPHRTLSHCQYSSCNIHSGSLQITSPTQLVQRETKIWSHLSYTRDQNFETSRVDKYNHGLNVVLAYFLGAISWKSFINNWHPKLLQYQ